MGASRSTAPVELGRSSFGQFGSLSEEYITLNGTSYEVIILMRFAGGLYLGARTELPDDFILHIGDQEYRASERTEFKTIAKGAYWWAMADPGWSKGDMVEVKVTMPEEPGSVADRPLAPPTAHFHQVPASHDGSKAIRFRIYFSDSFEVGFRTLRDQALEATNGSMAKANRANRGSNPIWETRVRPDGTDDMVITLPATEDCADDGVLCTVDGRMLYNTVAVMVPGPPALMGRQSGERPARETDRRSGQLRTHGGVSGQCR